MVFKVRVNVKVKLIKKTTSRIGRVVLDRMGCFGVVCCGILADRFLRSDKLFAAKTPL
jgi:hypothetical protein